MLVCMGMLAACTDTPEEPHVHTYSTTWTSDSSNHWYSATCECTDAPIVKLAHADKNNDGACDVCEYKVACAGGHTYSEDWTVDCTNHWHAADCGHVVAGADVAAHADGDGDGKCDVCAYVINDIHTHYYDSAWTGDGENHWHAALCEHKIEVADKAAHELNAAGYCTVCEAKVVEIDKTNFQAIIDAALASNGKVTGASVLASQISYDGSGADLTIGSALTNDVYFVLGETDTYVFWKSFDAEGNFLGADEYWYEYAGKDASGDDVVFGVGKTFGEYQIVPVAGNMKLLNGYNYVPGGILPSDSDDTSTLANVVSALYAIKTSGTNVSNVVERYDAESGAYTFGFDYFTVNTTEMSDGTVEYQVYYFETVVTFTVDENFVIDNAMILVDSYRNWELDNDLDYDHVQNTVTLKDTANPSRYTYMVAQTSGERTFTTPYPRESLIPQDFELYNGKGDWNDDTPPVLIITDYDKIEETVTFTEDDTVRIFLDDLDPITSSAMFINESDIVITAVNKDAASEGVLFTSTYYSKDYGFIGFSAKNAGSYDVTVKYGDVVKTFVAVVEEPESDIGDLEDNQFVVETTDTYSWDDEYVFVAEDGEGTYVLTLPAGLGLWSKKNLESNPFGAPEVDYYANAEGVTVEIELEAGDSYTFYIAALTRGEWVISYAYIASDVEGGDGDVSDGGEGGESGGTIAADISGTYYTQNGVLVINADGTMTYTVGTTVSNYTYVVDGNNVTYTLNGNTPYDASNGMATYFGLLIFGDDGMPEAFAYEMNTLPLSTTAPEGGDGGEGGEGGEGGDVNPSLPVLNLGENTIVLEESDLEEGKDYSFVAAEEGTYTVSGDLLAIFLDSEGMQLGRGQVSLAPGTYTVKFVNFMNAAGEFTVNVTYTAPSTGDGDGSEGNPYVWTELPESVSFNSDTVNKVYYLFTAIESGNITFTWPTADSWGDWFEMDGSNTTANDGSSFNKTTMTVPVEAGKTYRFGLGTNTAGDVTITIAFGAGSQGGEGGDGGEGGEPIASATIYDGEENDVTITLADIEAGKIFLTFTPNYTGEYLFMGDLYVVGAVTANGTSLELNDNYRFEFVAYETYTLEVSLDYVSEGVSSIAPEYQYPEGHQNNPFWYYISDDGDGNYVGESTVAGYKGDYAPVWYQFYASATGTLTVTSTNANATLLVTALPGTDIEGTGSVSMPVVQGRKYYIGVADFSGEYGVAVDVTFSASIVPGEIETNGTVNVPHALAIGSNTASVIDGGLVYFAYKFTADGTLVLSTESTNCYWYATSDLAGEPAFTSETSLSISAYSDQTVYIVITSANWQSDEIAFSSSVELDPTYVYYDGTVITDGSAANEIVIADNTYVFLGFVGAGEYVISWDNDDAIVEVDNFGNLTALVNGGVITGSNWGTNLVVRLPEYAAGTVNLTIAPATGGSEESGDYDLEVGDNTVSVTDTWEGNEVTFTATESGRYTFLAGANCVVMYDYSNYFEGDSFYVDLEADESVVFNVATEDHTASDVTVTVSQSAIGEIVAPETVDGTYINRTGSQRWRLILNDDGTGTLDNQTFANLSWSTSDSYTLTYTYVDGTLEIDFAEGAPAADGSYAYGGVLDYSGEDAEGIVGIMVNDAACDFYLFT